MKIIEFIYPKTCGMCNKISNSYICNKCKLKLKNQVVANTVVYDGKYFDSITYLFRYEGEIREKLLEYKFKEKSYLYKFFAQIILNNCKFKNNYDIILPVPIHKKRKAKRGYNQSSLIAREIANEIKIEYGKNILIKNANNSPQSTLNKTQRIKNVLGIYSVKNCEKIENKKVLLIDDICTTGSTVNECAKVLKQNGASRVDVLTIAKD